MVSICVHANLKHILHHHNHLLIEGYFVHGPRAITMEIVRALISHPQAVSLMWFIKIYFLANANFGKP
jgi:hypothetical protein